MRDPKSRSIKLASDAHLPAHFDFPTRVFSAAGRVDGDVEPYGALRDEHGTPAGVATIRAALGL
jgi:hypothetical protein